MSNSISRPRYEIQGLTLNFHSIQIISNTYRSSFYLISTSTIDAQHIAGHFKSNFNTELRFPGTISSIFMHNQLNSNNSNTNLSCSNKIPSTQQDSSTIVRSFFRHSHSNSRHTQQFPGISKSTNNFQIFHSISFAHRKLEGTHLTLNSNSTMNTMDKRFRSS